MTGERARAARWRRPLGPLQARILVAVERLGVARAVDVHRAVQPPALSYVTVANELGRLVAVGALVRTRGRRGVSYHLPAGADAARVAVRLAWREVLDVFGVAAVAATVELVVDDPQLRRALGDLLDGHG